MDLRKLYRQYNHQYFDNKLPKDTRIGWGRPRSEMAYLSVDDIIVIHEDIKNWPRVVMMCLLHEMVHMATNDVGHGRVWQRGMMRLARKGAFRNLW
jgi:hypothetical protein